MFVEPRRSCRSLSDLAMGETLKGLAQWLVYGLLAAAAIAILLVGKSEQPAIERLRVQVIDFFVPALDLIGQPVDQLASIAARIEHLYRLADENARLRDERQHLLQWQATAMQLAAENTELRALLNFAPPPDAHTITARVVGDSTSAFVQSVLVNAGASLGAVRGQVVLNGDGLVGRIAEVAPRSSIVLLITDLNSRIPVFVGPNQIRAIMAGDNTGHPRIIHAVSEEAIAPGDLVTSSGLAGGLPPGLPIGTVLSVDSGFPRVATNLDRNRLQYVRIVDYRLPAEFTGKTEAPRTAKAPPRASGPAGGSARP
jgi:rod shape-determining protein MreC